MIFTKNSFFFCKPRAYGKHIFATSYFQIRGSCVLYAMALIMPWQGFLKTTKLSKVSAACSVRGPISNLVAFATATCSHMMASLKRNKLTEEKASFQSAKASTNCSRMAGMGANLSRNFLAGCTSSTR